MSLRFGLNTLFVLAAGFLVVASRVFDVTTVGWLGFAIGTGVTVLATAALAAGRPREEAVGYGAAFAVGLWTLVAALVFSGSVLTWLVFADALGIAAVALANLVVHEVSTERVVHTLDVREERGLAHAA